MYSISSIKFANFFNIFNYIFIHTFFNEIKSPCKLKIGEENNFSLFLSLIESHGRGIISWIICNEIEERIQWRRTKRRRQLAFSREELKKLNSAPELNSLFRKHATRLFCSPLPPIPPGSTSSLEKYSKILARGIFCGLVSIRFQQQWNSRHE